DGGARYRPSAGGRGSGRFAVPRGGLRRHWLLTVTGYPSLVEIGRVGGVVVPVIHILRGLWGEGKAGGQILHLVTIHTTDGAGCAQDLSRAVPDLPVVHPTIPV